MEEEETSLNFSVINLALKNKRILSLVVFFAVFSIEGNLYSHEKINWDRSSADIDFLQVYHFGSVILITKK